ncbi:MAG: DNA repair protein RadA [Spirochaetales bacterium]|uniref:DNA repair protein RadA n=1 Tax=Candidatus Thalassospirochaeta sargassi TaxID=3119039 RepID=A0AAJ1MJB0_9SPIO|nr:DNA repair protein RadA [Spirochaetales bacterium]
MAKEKIRFECSSCGNIEPKWLGKCPACGSWNSFIEIKPVKPVSSKSATGSRTEKKDSARPQKLSRINTTAGTRYASGQSEADRVLGGGVMRGASVLVGGEPGIGKSTLMLQLSSSLIAEGPVLYISGEESASQLKMRADRLGITRDIEVLCETEIGSILKQIDRLKPVMIVTDSVQTLYNSELGMVAGTVNQIKFCSDELITRAKLYNCPLFLVAHVTKEGNIAGPKVLEHMVDTVLYFEHGASDVRLLRAVKNRFGSIDEIGLFKMSEKGLMQVDEPASLFLVKRKGEQPAGTCTAAVYEGSRVLMMEIQALTVPAKGGLSRVFSEKIDGRRVSRVAAVLEKNLSLRFSDQDIYVNVAGGIKIDEVGTDLPLALALYSARTGIQVPPGTACSGEISLAGEIMPVAHLDRRSKTAADMGFKNFVSPGNTSGLKESIQKIFGK